MYGDYNKAKEVLEDSLEIYNQIRPKDHPDIGRNVQNLGVIYGEIGDYKKAKELLVKSLKDYEINYGIAHIETGKVLNHLGRFYILSKDFKNAEQSLKRGSDILKITNHPESYRSYELLGDLYNEKREEHQKIANSYKHSLELALKYFAKESKNVIRVKQKIDALQNS